MHIMSDEQYNRLMAMKAYLEDPAPLPMTDPAEYSAMNYGNAWDEREHTGLLEKDA